MKTTNAVDAIYEIKVKFDSAELDSATKLADALNKALEMARQKGKLNLEDFEIIIKAQKL